MPRIAISYRRADSAAITGRIFDRLLQRYGAGSVFMDIDEIPFGIDFRTHIAEVLSTCDALVAIIGQRWFGADGGRLRLDEESDPVRIEVRAALDRNIPVIPVLVDGAAMPGADELPEPLRPLAFRNACPVDSGRDFHAHVDRLIRSMDRILGAGPIPAREAGHGDRPKAAGGGAPSPLTRGPVSHAAHGPLPPRAGEAQAPPARRLCPRDTALLAGFTALPQLVQFTQRTPLFVLGLFVSVVAAATILDRPDLGTGRRMAMATLVIGAGIILQSAVALLRASFLPW